MDGDKDQERTDEEENVADDPAESLFPESQRQSPKELDLDFLPVQESPQDLFPPVSEPEEPLPPPTTQRAPSPPLPQRRSRRSPSSYYHPNDYYLGTDWPRVIVGGLLSLLILGGVVLLAVYLFDKFDAQNEPPTVIPSQIEEIVSVRVYSCAGDSIPINEIEPPSQAFLEGKNAAGTWVAFRDPSSPLNQLWARADELPALDFGSLAILSCNSSESSQDEESPLSGDNNG
tara:strand:- start:533 stop:1225 length:693 start_codon:yes stop_codon:yes gene_type:complete